VVETLTVQTDAVDRPVDDLVDRLRYVDVARQHLIPSGERTPER